MSDKNEDRCAWCLETGDEHSGFGNGCDEFIPIDWRARAHALLDRIIGSGQKFGAFAADDGPWLVMSLRLRGAVIRAQEEIA